jgi:hypothetical protein
MHSFVTANTEGYQIGLDVIAQTASRLYVVDLKSLCASARLAMPSIAL